MIGITIVIIASIVATITTISLCLYFHCRLAHRCELEPHQPAADSGRCVPRLRGGVFHEHQAVAGSFPQTCSAWKPAIQLPNLLQEVFDSDMLAHVEWPNNFKLFTALGDDIL